MRTECPDMLQSVVRNQFKSVRQLVILCLNLSDFCINTAMMSTLRKTQKCIRIQSEMSERPHQIWSQRPAPEYDTANNAFPLIFCRNLNRTNVNLLTLIDTLQIFAQRCKNTYLYYSMQCCICSASYHANVHSPRSTRTNTLKLERYEHNNKHETYRNKSTKISEHITHPF